MLISPRRVVLLWLLAASSGPSLAQVSFDETTVLQAPAPVFANTFGNAPVAADLDDDGFDDIVCGEPYASVGGTAQAGRVWIILGPNFRGMKSVSSGNVTELERLGLERGCVGDVNGDGALDILAAAPDCPVAGLDRVGRAHIFLGPDFSTETILDDPTPEAGGRFSEGNLLHDVDGDGLADILIGAPGLGSAWADPSPGEWWMWNASALTAPIALPNPMSGLISAQFGVSITAGDVDADGVDEVLVGMLGTLSVAPFVDGATVIFALPSFQVQQTVVAPSFPDFTPYDFGQVHHVGDMDGDNIADLVVSAPEAGFIGVGTVGALLVLRGPTFQAAGSVLLSPAMGIGTHFFGDEAFVSDFDGDGAKDVLVGDYGVGDIGNAVRLFYGPSLTSVQSFSNTPFFNNGFARWVAPGDFDDDGWPDFLAADINGSGSLHVYDHKTLFAEASAISWSQGGDLPFHVDVGKNYSNSIYLGLLGLSGSLPGTVPAPGAFLPLNVDGLTILGLKLLGTPSLSNFIGVLDSAGQGSFSLSVPPAVPVLVPGQTLDVSSIIMSPGLVFQTGSSTVEVSVGP